MSGSPAIYEVNVSSTGREWGVGLMHAANLRMCQERMEKRNKPLTTVTKFLRLNENFRNYRLRSVMSNASYRLSQ